MPRVVPSGSEVPALAAYFPAVAAGPFLGRRELLPSGQQLLKRPGVAGSLKVTNEPPGWTSTSLACTPCSMSSRRGVSKSATTHYTSRCELGGISVLPVPSTMEHADPGGVSWTNRSASLTWWSRSAWSRPAPRGPPWHGQHQLLLSPPARFSSSRGSSRPSATC
jgi:hypothetical protein